MSDGSGRGPGQATTFSMEFNRSVRVSASEQRLSSDGGALLLRELDDRLGLTRGLAARVTDPRDPRFIDYSVAELLRERLYLVAQGWCDQNDANLLRDDPALRVAVADTRGQGAIDRTLASQSSQSRLIDMLARRPNRVALRWALTDLAVSAQKLLRGRPLESFTLDIDSTDKETHGEQEGALRNGHYRHRCYHPLLAYVGETGDLVGAWLRRGVVHSQRGASAFVTGLLDRLHGAYGRVAAVRGDAAFTTPKLMRVLEARGVDYVFRIKSNSTLEGLAAPLLANLRLLLLGEEPSARREPREWTFTLEYKAGTWERARRVVLVVVDDPSERFMGKANPRHFFLVTSFPHTNKSNSALVEYYRQRGTSENWIGELKNDVLPNLSSPRMVENAATFMIGALAFQLAHLLRVLATALERRPSRFTIASVRVRALKVAVRFTTGKRRLFATVAASAWSVWSKVLAWLARPRSLRARLVT